MNKSLVSLLASILISSNALAFELTPELVDGIYDLAAAERSTKGQTKKLSVQYGELNGMLVLVTKACKQCMPAVYKKLPEESNDLARPVFFNAMGIYIIAYDTNTFVSVMADGQLGKMIWSKVAYANVYNKQGTPGIDLAAGKDFVLAESKRLMTGEGAPAVAVTGGSGKYFAAVRQTIGSTSCDQFEVTVEAKKEITLSGKSCKGSSEDSYKYRAEISAAIGKNAYEMGNMGRFIIEHDTGVLLWNNLKMGETLWKDTSNFNVFAQDKTVVKKLMIDEAKQKEVDQAMANYAKIAKAAVDLRYAKEDQARTAKNALPAKGLSDAELNAEALNAAKARAGREGWNETIEDAYIRGTDWNIERNKLTGIQTGRYIAGVIVMRRKDSLCSYQSVHFGQQYNGSGYQKAYVYSIDSGQNKLDCSKI